LIADGFILCSSVRRYNSVVLARLFTFIAALSLLLCLVTVATWVRSFWVTDLLTRKVDGVWDIPVSRVHAVFSARGGFVFVEEYTRIDNIAAAYLNMIPVEWKRDRSPAEPAYPSLTLAQVSLMDGKARRQFSFRILGLIVAYRDEFPDVQRIHQSNLLIVIPDALIAGLTALLPTLWIYRWRQRRRLAAVQLPCHRCGYSLVGNTSGICPECGSQTVVAN
jgi:hypothetical protein